MVPINIAFLFFYCLNVCVCGRTKWHLIFTKLKTLRTFWAWGEPGRQISRWKSSSVVQVGIAFLFVSLPPFSLLPYLLSSLVKWYDTPELQFWWWFWLNHNSNCLKSQIFSAFTDTGWILKMMHVVKGTWFSMQKLKLPN